MAGLTLTQSAYLSQEDLAIGVMEEIITRDSFTAVLPARTISGDTLKINREATEHNAAAVDINGDVPDTSGSVAPVTFSIGRVAGQNLVDQYQRIISSNKQSIGALHLRLLAKKIRKAWAAYVISGTGTGLQPTGLVTQATSDSRVFDKTGSTFSLDLLDAGFSEVKDVDGDIFGMVNETVASRIRSLMRALGGNTIGNIEVGFIDPTTGETGQRKVLAFQGQPIFINNNLANDQLITGVMDEVDGVHAIVNERLEGMVLPELGIPHPTKPGLIDRLSLCAGIGVANKLALSVYDGFSL